LIGQVREKSGRIPGFWKENGAIFDEPMIHYNLACYECVMGEAELGKARLRHALKLEPRLRVMALEDEDLRGVWAEL